MSEASVSKRKPRKAKETIVERRLKDGCALMKTVSPEAPTGAIWTYTDSGKSARADVCTRLLQAGKLKGRGDGLFGDAQTYELASA